MSIVPMRRIEILALRQDRKAILEALQRRGVVEICHLPEQDKVFESSDMSESTAVLRKNKQLADEALEILDYYVPEKKSLLASFSGRSEVSKEDYDSFADKKNDVLKDIKRIVNLSKTISESKAEITKLNLQIEMLEPWINLDIPLETAETKRTKVFIGSLPGVWDQDAVTQLLAEFGPVEVEILSVLRDQTFMFVIGMKANADGIYEKLRTSGFAKPAVLTNMSPAEQKVGYENTIHSLEDEMEEAKKEIKTFVDKREDIKFFSDYEIMREDKYEVIGQLLQSEHTFVLDGYVPVNASDDVKTYIESKYMSEVTLSEPSPDEDVPVLLKNNGFAEPLEGVTEGFSSPGKGEIDPTFVMSLFYYILFGIMFSDAGYGLLLAVGCGFLLLKFKNMETSMKKNLKMFFFCGISTIFWGIVFSSYFGDIVDVVSSTFFGQKISIPPLWFSPTAEPMRMLVFSMVLGILHLFTGLVLKFYQSAKNGDILGGIYDGILWILLISSSITLLMTTEMFMSIIGMDFVLPKIVGTISTIVALLSALGIVLTNGRESKNPVKRIMKGAYALYGVTSYLGDILSYSRLLALGLATGVIGTVINKMGSMVGSGFVKVIAFILVFCIGHLLNFAINVLGAYVHSNRLQYVEFFGKFYEGGGRKFEPFRVKTKYFKIKEK